MLHTSSKYTGVQCHASIETIQEAGDGTITRVILDAGECLDIEVSMDGRRVVIDINGEWERDGVLACLASVLAAHRIEVRRGE